MFKTLDDIASVYSGIYAQTQNKGEVYYVQARHFDAKRSFISDVQPELSANNNFSKHYLQKGDILIAAKGYEHFAVCYSGKIAPAVASSMFIVIRIEDQQQVLPAYLCWFLNHQTTQKVLSGKAKGTSLPAITKPDIGNLQIPVPTLEKQEKILLLHSLWQREKQLIQEIESLREKQIQQQLLQSAQYNA